MPLAQLVAESPYVRVSRRDRPTHRLVCLPVAGAGASAFRHLPEALPSRIEVVSIQLPGREDRIREQPFTRMEPLIGALTRVLRPYLDLPVAFFGHSSGALLAYELVRAITAAGPCPAPLRLIASGHPPPHLPSSHPPVAGLPDDELLENVVALNGTPLEVAAHAQLRELILPAIRCDFAMWESYRHRAGPPLPWPVSVFGGDCDDLAASEHLAGWELHTSGSFGMRVFEGDHFFLHTQADSVHRAIAELLS